MRRRLTISVSNEADERIRNLYEHAKQIGAYQTMSGMLSDVMSWIYLTKKDDPNFWKELKTWYLPE